MTDRATPWSEYGAEVLSRIIEATPAAVMLTDARARILAVNPAFFHVTGYSEAEIVGKNPSVLASGRHDQEFFRRFWTALTDEGHWQGEIWNRRRDATLFPEWLSVARVPGAKATEVYYVAVFSDVSALKLADDRVMHLAYHDPLTGLANRTLFEDRLQQAILRAQRSQRLAAAVFIDLDDFKHINDLHGHRAGDLYLKELTTRLVANLRRTDTAARIGGDEFGLVLDDFDTRSAIEAKTQQIFDAVTGPASLPFGTVDISASFGVAVFPEDAQDARSLVAVADAAMYRAKASGKNQIRFTAPA